MNVTLPAIPRFTASLPVNKLLADDEIIVIVDDDYSIREPLKMYLEQQGLSLSCAGSSTELMHLLDSRNVALILLDIGLPDADGLSVLPQIVERYRDIAVIMLTGVVDLHVALECLRRGADDYLSKPVQFHEILFVVKKALEKRRLTIENRRYQEELLKATFRTQLLHQLTIKMNSVYLSTPDLDNILRAVLVGITAEEGLRFNRAILALFDDRDQFLRGRIAIGPGCRDEAAKIWTDIKEKRLQFMDILSSLASCNLEELPVNQIAHTLSIPAANLDHILIKSARERKSYNIINGQGDGPISQELMQLLDEGSFVVTPLFSPRKAYGVIIADNFVTHQPITDEDVAALEVFANQASLAIEQSHLYADMEQKIKELEDVNQELDRNKDLLVEAERYSALGQMAAQLVHGIRNPVTSIGGVARIVSKRAKEKDWQKYVEVIIKESERLEAILGDLFDFVNPREFNPEITPMCQLLRKTVMLVQSAIVKQGIQLEFDLIDPDEVYLNIDKQQIKQMLLHILRNAIEAMPEGGLLRIELKQDERSVHISIMDTGVGIAEAHLLRVKDPFYTTKTYGTGLGLTMVERVVKAHGGNFSLKRREPSGMHVQIDLPKSLPTEVSPPPQ